MTQPSDRPPAPASDRRGAARQPATLPARLRVRDLDATVLVRDVSTSGALLYLQKKLHKGEEVSLDLYLRSEIDKPTTVTATVVRGANRDPKTAGIWPYSAAVRFAEPKLEIEPLAKRLAEEQGRLGLRKA